MSLSDLLDRRVDVVDPGETVVDGKIVEARVTVAEALPVRIDRRRDRTVVYAEDGKIVTDHDVYHLERELTVGLELVDGTGATWVVSGPSDPVHGAAGVDHYETPARRIR